MQPHLNTVKNNPSRFIITNPALYVYAGTRIRIRRSGLLTREEYLRMLNMSIPQILRFAGERGYSRELHILSRSSPGISQIEYALVRNLSTAVRDVRTIATGHLHEPMTAFLRRWDIVSLTALLHQKRKGLPRENIADYLISAIDLDSEVLQKLLALRSEEEVVRALSSWKYYNELREEYRAPYQQGFFHRLENRLYQRYYADLIRLSQSGIRGGAIFREYIRLEIDFLNIKTMIRLRIGLSPADIRPFLISGGAIPTERFGQAFASEDPDPFLMLVQTLPLHQKFLDTYAAHIRNLTGTTGNFIQDLQDLWRLRKHPPHEIETLLTSLRLEKMESISKRHPFSILPFLMYLERKKYEVFNIRAIIQGKSDDLPAELIRRYLVI